MRIIAGRYKGRKLEVPKAREARPTSEKVREAVFSMLQNYIEGAKVADLFADESRAYGLISLGSTTAALSGATKVIVKTPHEAFGIPTKEANAGGIKTIPSRSAAPTPACAPWGRRSGPVA